MFYSSTITMPIPHDLAQFLAQHKLDYTYQAHEPCHTVEESKALKTSLPGVSTKNLFLTDMKGQYWLVCVQADKRVPINKLRKLLGTKTLTFASPEELLTNLQLTPGSVSLFGLIHKPNNLQVCLDDDLRQADLVGRHPNRNDATLIIDHQTLVVFLTILQYQPIRFTLSDDHIQLL